jgi:hypothetical protein
MEHWNDGRMEGLPFDSAQDDKWKEGWKNGKSERIEGP